MSQQVWEDVNSRARVSLRYFIVLHESKDIQPPFLRGFDKQGSAVLLPFGFGFQYSSGRAFPDRARVSFSRNILSYIYK